MTVTGAADIAAPDRTLPRMLALQAQKWGAKDLFSCLDAHWRYADIERIAAEAAGRLAAAGINAGDRVAILSANRPEILQFFLGCGWLGAVAVPLNIAVKTRQLRYYLENSGARLLIADSVLLAALDDGALAGLPLEMCWTFDGSVSDRLGLRMQHCSPIQRAVPPHPVKPGDPLAILYTSGTTGAPKGVICPHAQFYWWGVHAARFLEIISDDVLVTTLPLFHTNAINCFFQALLTGAKQVVLPRFSASAYWEQMAEQGATVGYLLGAMVPMILAQPVRSAERTHRIRVALGPGVPSAMHNVLFSRTGVRLVDGFGSTETNFIIGSNANARVAGRMGRLAPGFSAIVADAEDNPLGDEMPGELLARSEAPYAFASGYYEMPEKTVESWRNLWFHTGDRVIRHSDGTFSFLDRLKDVIRRRGENISSFEVEQVIAVLPQVESVAVYPVPSDLAEDEVMAALVLRNGEVLSAADVFQHCARELPRHAVPRYIRFFADLPRTENGKIQKFRLRELGITPDVIDRMEA